MMKKDDFIRWKKKVYNNPTGIDISSLDPSEYKFFDGYRNAVYLFREEQMDKEECEERIRMLVKEYELNLDKELRSLRVCMAHQDIIRKSDEMMVEMIKGAYSEADTLSMALDLIGVLREDKTSIEAVKRNLMDRRQCNASDNQCNSAKQ